MNFIVEKKEKKRIQSIDLIRGFAIILMILAHVFDQWLEPSSLWFSGIYYLVVSPIGIPGFIFAAGLSFGITWAQKQKDGLDFKLNTIYAFSRSCILLGIAICFNILGVFVHHLGFENIWLWFILLTMAVARLLAPYFMILNKLNRIIAAMIIIFATHFLLKWLLIAKSESTFAEVLYFICFNTIDTDSILFFMPIFLFGTVLGEQLLGYIGGKEITKDLKHWTYFGIGLVVVGILFGWEQSTYFYGWDKVLVFLSTYPSWNVTSLPIFLCRNSYAWVLFGSGLVLLMMIFLFYFIDYRNQGKKSTSPIFKIFIVYPQIFGKYSLTIYLSHYIGYLLPWELSYKWIFFAFFLYAMIFWSIMFCIDKYGKGRFSVENILVWGSNNNYRYLSHRIIQKKEKDNPAKHYN